MKNIIPKITLWAGLCLLLFPPAGKAQPTATTLAATSISQTNATLHGTVNPNGQPVVAYFQYGLTTNYGCIGGYVALPATNTAQTLTGLVVNGLAGAAGANWTQTGAPSQDWESIASSADGTRLAAASVDFIYTSTNGGVNWTQTSAPEAGWSSIASSADGTHLAAAIYGVGSEGIYTSTNAGINWTPTSAPAGYWPSIASSADGTRLAAVIQGGGIYSSTNGGVTWTQTGAPSENWFCIASSGDGLHLAAAAYGGGIYTSTSGGATWTETSAINGQGWTTISSSADGTRLAAAPGSESADGYIYFSTNSGLAWTQANVLQIRWAGLATSADGMRLEAASYSGIYTSQDGGNSWALSTPATGAGCIASSAGGAQLAAGCLNGYVYTSVGTVNSLQPATTYHYRVVALNSLGTSVGSDLTFTIPGAPTVITLAASGVTATNATLNGTVNPNAVATSAYFRYGLTTNYGSYTATNALPATNVTLSVSNLIGSLTLGTTYHFQLVASNSLGSSLGSDLAFITPVLPEVTTLAASGITGSGATLNGSVNPSEAATSAYFRYGLTTNYGSYSATNELAATNATLSVSNLISSLSPGETYHFQLVGSNVVGATLGGDLTFITPALPGVTTLAASGITSSNAMLNGTVNPNEAATSAYFRYGLTTNYGSYSATNELAATNATLAVSSLISSLSPGETYYFQLVASNSVGVTWGSDLTFITLALPAVTTLAASGITSSNATLNGTVNPNEAATSAYFRYGLTTNYGSYSATNALAATNETLSVSNLIGGLSPGTSYYFQLLASNSVGLSPGIDKTFITSAEAPTATTLGATSITGTNATLNGRVNPNGAASTAYFRFGLTTNYGSYSATNALAATNVTLSLSNMASSLTPATSYHFQLVASNSLGASLGGDLTFTTTEEAPTATTLPAIDITATNALLNGTVDPNGAATSAYFRYGLTTNYGSYSATNSLAATFANLSVSNLVSGLTPGTAYHFRLVASNNAGTATGSDLMFTNSAAQAVSFSLNDSIKLAGGAFQFSFTNLSGLGFTVLGTTNLAQPLTSWTVLGAPVESPPGHYQFTDPQATNKAASYYSVRSP